VWGRGKNNPVERGIKGVRGQRKEPETDLYGPLRRRDRAQEGNIERIMEKGSEGEESRSLGDLVKSSGRRRKRQKSFKIDAENLLIANYHAGMVQSRKNSETNPSPTTFWVLTRETAT